jgi:hypothetical protein
MEPNPKPVISSLKETMFLAKLGDDYRFIPKPNSDAN